MIRPCSRSAHRDHRRAIAALLDRGPGGIGSSRRGSRGSSRACARAATRRCWRSRGKFDRLAGSIEVARAPRSSRASATRRARCGDAIRLAARHIRRVAREADAARVDGQPGRRRQDRAARHAARPRRLLRPGWPLPTAVVAADDGDSGARRRCSRDHRRLSAARSRRSAPRPAKPGVDRLYRLGGAHAIAALAYGTATIARVDKIVGPGNAYVAAAKALVADDCAIDFFAGPSEIAVVSDTGRPDWIAADLIAQAEHDPHARAILITPSTPAGDGGGARGRPPDAG